MPRFDRSFLDRRRGPGVEGRRRDERERELGRLIAYLNIYTRGNINRIDS